MKVAYFTGLRQIELRDEAAPRLERPDDVLVRIDCVGVCGSDIHYYTDGAIGQQRLTYPATLGHECAGTIAEVGRNVAHVKPGDRVAIDPAIVCGECDQCRAGRVNTCRNIQFMGSPGQAPGAVAEFRVLPAENCLPIPAGMTLEQATLVEPLSVGLYATRLGEIYPAVRVAILGAGPIGLSVLLCAKATAPCTVYMTDLFDERLAVARRCGADWTGMAKNASTLPAIMENEPWGLDLVFECSGDPATIDQAQELLTPGGTLVLVGIPPTVQASFDIHKMRTKELTFKNVRRQKGCVAPAIRLIHDGHIDPAPLLTHRYPLARLQDAFDLIAGYKDGVIKAVVEVGES